MAFYAPEGYGTVNILAIDPGLNNLGIAIYSIDCATRTICSIDAYSVVVAKLTENDYFDTETHGERLEKLVKIREMFMTALGIYKPCTVVSEAPFYNPLRPGAYRALVEVIAYLEMTTLTFDNRIPFYQISPQSVKQGVGVAGKKGKDPVAVAVSGIEPIMSKLKPNLVGLTEHAVDAIAVGYSFLKQVEL